VIQGDRAREILMKSRLPLGHLAQIWELADNEHNGSLDPAGFVVAMYLVQGAMTGHLKTIPPKLPSSIYLQASSVATGVKVLSNNWDLPSPSTNFDPISSRPSPPLPPTPNGFYSTVWDIPMELRNTADEFFVVLDEENKGYLGSQAVRGHLTQTGLSQETARQIWELSDINKDGRLTSGEFAVTLYLLQSKLEGNPLPSVLPYNLIPPNLRPRPPAGSNDMDLLQLIDFSEATHASGSGSMTTHRDLHRRASSAVHLPSSASSSLLDVNNILAPIPSQHTGDPSRIHSPSPLSPLHSRSVSVPVAGPSIPINSTRIESALPPLPAEEPWDWDVTRVEKARSDGFFDMLDPWKHGFIEREVAIPFLAKSKLHGDLLGQIWRLADADNNGRLGKDDLAVAMHLVKQKLAGKDIPKRLPTSLIPPSARQEVDPFADGVSDVGAEEESVVGVDVGGSVGGDVPVPQIVLPTDSAEDDTARSSTPPPPYSAMAGEGEEP